MKNFLSHLMALRGDRSGATAIEYALVIGVIAVAIVAGMAFLTADDGILSDIETKVQQQVDGTTGTGG